jgi:hypothetical protein
MANRIDVARVKLSSQWRSSLLVLVLATLLTACTYQYSFDEPELRGKVVDGSTGKPLSGAIVAAYWGVQDGNLAGGSWVAEYVRFFEATTDDKGEFVIPAWSEHKLVKGKIADQFPSTLVYKSGYRLATWQGKTVKDWPARPVVLTPNSEDTLTQNDMHTIKYWFGPGIGGCMWQNFTGLYSEELLFKYAMRTKYVPADLRTDYKHLKKYPSSAYRSPSTSVSQMVYEPAMIEAQVESRSEGNAAGRDYKCTNPTTLLR